MSWLYVFRWMGILEGISYLLFALTMPLKYGASIIWPNKIVGMTHGIFFVCYVLAVFLMRFKYGWTIKKTGLALLASLLPLGTFYFNKYVLK